jgi:hypothetical protein
VEEDIRVIEVMSVWNELLDGVGRGRDEEVLVLLVLVLVLVLVPVVLVVGMEVEEEDLFMKDETSRSAKGVYMRRTC